MRLPSFATVTLAFAVILLTAAPAGAQSALAGTSYGPLQASGDQVVPPSGSSAVAENLNAMRFYPDTNELQWSIDVEFEPTAAHLHLGAPGANGPEIAASDLEFLPWGDWRISNRVVLQPAEITALFAGDVYLDVHSAAHPSGEIRSQLYLYYEDLGGNHPVSGPVGLGLTFTGALVPGENLSIFVGASNVPSGQQGLMALSLASTPLPYFSGVLHAFPFTTTVLLTFTGPIAGLGTTWPAGIPPGTTGVVQTLLVNPEPTVPGDFVLSNAVRFTTY